VPLTLTIRNAAQLQNGSPLSLVLDRRGATIGRAATTDWCLPDPTLHISSRHCEVCFTDGRYDLVDHSTNGTFVYGQAARLAAPHPIGPGDVFVVGPYEITAALDDAAAAVAAERNAAPQAAEWKGWGAADTSAAAPAASLSKWDATPSGSAISGSGPMSQSWAPPAAADTAPAADWGAPPPPPSATPSTWDVGPAPTPMAAASDWSSPAAPPPPPSTNDVWGQFAASNVVDWARGGFGSPPPPPVSFSATPAAASGAASFGAMPTPAASDPFGLTPTPQPPSNPDPFGLSAPSSAPAVAPASDPFGLSAPAPVADSFGTPPAPAMTMPPTAQQPAPPPIAAPAPPPQPQPVAPAQADGAALAALLHAAGVDPARLKQGEGEVLHQAGNLLRRLVSGLVVMLEARARAKSQMGAQGTNLEFDGNNPLKFARTPEQALVQMLNPPERGFMSTDRAIEDAYKDLQAHQMATLKAMQGALRATLERFSPTAIRSRAQDQGLIAKIMPGAREAALWNAYEKEFSGVAHGSDEAFMDMFAKEFRRAYEEIATGR
jgi:type VI secretion system FHA domain protein